MCMRPNLLFIMHDPLRADFIATPHIGLCLATAPRETQDLSQTDAGRRIARRQPRIPERRPPTLLAMLPRRVVCWPAILTMTGRLLPLLAAFSRELSGRTRTATTI